MQAKRRAALLSVLLAWIAVPGGAAAVIANPSFEADGESFFFTTTRFPDRLGRRAGWRWAQGQVTFGVGNTDGAYAADLFVAVSGAAPGADQFPVRLTQSVDLTGVDAIAFDARLARRSRLEPAGGRRLPDRRRGGVVPHGRRRLPRPGRRRERAVRRPRDRVPADRQRFRSRHGRAQLLRRQPARLSAAPRLTGPASIPT